MRYTLLELTQAILNEVLGDEVTSISDTAESATIANILKDVYSELIDSRDWEHLRKLTKPSASPIDSTLTHFLIDEGITKVEWIKYDKQTSDSGGRKTYEAVDYKFPDEFVDYVMSRDSTDSTITTVTDPDGTELLIRNDTAPLYWTSFDDATIVFDAYDSEMDTAGTDADKIQMMVYTLPTWSHLDSATADLPDDCFSLLLEEAKSRAWIAFKGEANQKAEQSAQRLRRRVSRSAWVTNNGLRYKNYGRRGVK